MKIKITFSISQTLCGHIKNVASIAHSEDACWLNLYKAYGGRGFSFKVLNVQQVENNYPSGLMQADSQTIVSYKNVSSVMCGAALPVFSEPHQNN